MKKTARKTKKKATFIKVAPPKELWQAARGALKNAYSPYSRIKVGAAVLMSDGKIYAGCNVENASYGGTICAERTAIVKAISSGSSRKIVAVLITTNRSEVWPPCGLCRQVMAEFCAPQTTVYCTNQRGDMQTIHFSALFPGAFQRSFLKV